MQIAVVCASGIGDALIFHSASFLFVKKGWKVTTYSDHLASFGPWLERFDFSPQPKFGQIQEIFSKYDAIFLQHDNSLKALQIKALNHPAIYTFYGSHLPQKHGPLQPNDYVCDRTISMVENLKIALNRFFKDASSENGLAAPSHLIHRKYPKRIAIHPTASSEGKRWPREKFLDLAKDLQTEGYDPIFTVSPMERAAWDSPLLATLGDLSSFLYESGFFIGNDSGTGHLASYLKIPHLIIGGNGLQMPLWRTGWLPGELLIPPPFFMQFKALRHRWSMFISKNMVINNFKHRVLQN